MKGVKVTRDEQRSRNDRNDGEVFRDGEHASLLESLYEAREWLDELPWK